MARMRRAVIPGFPHHITQRGNRRQRTFFELEDYDRYLELMADRCSRFGVEIWAFCLMPNHVHMIAVPETEEGLRRAIGEAHRCYTEAVNRREGWRGYLWQGRFASFVMDERYTLAAARYVELNPVRAGLVALPEQYLWSSARAHLAGRDDALVRVEPMLARVPEWRAFLHSGLTAETAAELRKHQSSGRPLGDDAFVERMEQRAGRSLRPAKRGPKPRGAIATEPLQASADAAAELSIVSPKIRLA